MCGLIYPSDSNIAIFNAYVSVTLCRCEVEHIIERILVGCCCCVTEPSNATAQDRNDTPAHLQLRQPINSWHGARNLPIRPDDGIVSIGQRCSQDWRCFDELDDGEPPVSALAPCVQLLLPGALAEGP